MKIFTLLVLLSFSLFATDIKTKAKIKEVIVYTSGAQINSEVPTTIPKGTSIVRITDVSPFVNQNTIQLNGLKDISILSIGFEVATYPKKMLSDKIKNFEKEILIFQREIALQQNTIKGLEEEKSILNLNKNLGSTQQAAAMDKILLHSKHYRERIPVLEMEIYDINKKIILLAEDLKLKQLEYQKNLGDSNENKGEIILKFNNPNEAMTLNLGLKYLVSGAGWVPSYEIKAKNSKEGLDFSYKAQVYQTSGEDWNDIKLTLSTGNPSFNNDKPTVDTHYLNFINPTIYNATVYDKKINFIYNPMVKMVTGVVTDNSGPIPGVNVMVQGTNIGTQTDFDGRYTIKIENGKELVYSFVGMNNTSLPIIATQ